MPRKPMRPCATPGCPGLVNRGKCDRCKQRGVKRQGNNDGRAPWYRQARTWYNSARWRHEWQPKLLREQPLCVLCQERDEITPSEVADHKEPHRGVYERFWDWANLQGLCTECHNRKSRQERGEG